MRAFNNNLGAIQEENELLDKNLNDLNRSMASSRRSSIALGECISNASIVSRSSNNDGRVEAI